MQQSTRTLWIKKLLRKEGDLVYSIAQQDALSNQRVSLHAKTDRHLLKAEQLETKFSMKTVIFHASEQFGHCCHFSYLPATVPE